MAKKLAERDFYEIISVFSMIGGFTIIALLTLIDTIILSQATTIEENQTTNQTTLPEGTTSASPGDIRDSRTLSLFSQETRTELLSLREEDLRDSLSTFRDAFEINNEANASGPRATNTTTTPEGSLVVKYHLIPSEVVRNEYSVIMLGFTNNEGDLLSNVNYKIEFEGTETNTPARFAPRGLDMKVIDEDTFASGSEEEPAQHSVRIIVESFNGVTSNEAAVAQVMVVPEYPLPYIILIIAPLIGTMTLLARLRYWWS